MHRAIFKASCRDGRFTIGGNGSFGEPILVSPYWACGNQPSAVSIYKLVPSKGAS